jgi:hypothetical protein
MPTISEVLAMVDALKRGIATNPTETLRSYATGAAGGVGDMIDMAGNAFTNPEMQNPPTVGPGMREGMRTLLGGSSAGAPSEQMGGMFGFPTATGAKLAALLANKAAVPAVGLLGQLVYHGTPHTFSKYDLSKIGTGEGAQAFGRGVYFADAQNTGKTYQQTLAQYQWADAKVVAAELPKAFQGSSDNARKIIDDIQQALKSGDIKNGSEYLKAFDVSPALQPAYKKAGQLMDAKGNLYAQDLPDEVLPKMLQWDKPLSEHPESVQKALAHITAAEPVDGMALTGGGKLRITNSEDFGRKYFLEMGDSKFPLAEADVKNLVGSGADGKSIYQALITQLGSDQAASEYLKSRGIPGLSYLDQGSRTAGKGTMNHVIWDQALLDRMPPQAVP